MRSCMSDRHFIKWLHQPHFVIAGSSLGCQNSFARVVCSRLRLCLAMVKGPNTFRRPSLQVCFAISGGLLKKPELVERVGPDDKFLCLSPRNVWLCKFCSETRACRGPLRRTKVLQHLISEFQRLQDLNIVQAAAVHDPMQDLQLHSIALTAKVKSRGFFEEEGQKCIQCSG